MQRCIRILATGLVAVTLLAAVSASSQAAVRILGAGGFTATSIGTLDIASAIVTLRCSVTLEGTFNSGPISVGQAAGSVTRGTISPNPCQGFVWSFLNLPWSIVLLNDSLAPTTLSPTGGALFGISTFQYSWGPCLFTGQLPLLVTNVNAVATVLTNTLDGGFCGSASFTARFQVTPSATRVISA
jgi:ABC-type Na+ efflux pump permease subunit